MEYSFLKPPTETPYNVLSLGVQSTAMALMAAKGEITPMPNIAIFADTQAEPKSVYEHLEWLKKQLPFPVGYSWLTDIINSQERLYGKRDTAIVPDGKKDWSHWKTMYK